MDIFEHLVLIMIIRREVIHFAIKNNQMQLLNIFDFENQVIEKMDKETVERAKQSIKAPA